MDATTSRQVRRLLGLTVLALTACALIYLLAVHTEIGHRADQGALRGGDRTPQTAQAAASRMLRVVSIGGLVTGIAVLGGVAALRRRRRLILVPGAVIGISLIAVELLKEVILTRPPLLADPEFIQNTYPSGHVTVAISLGLAAIIVAPPALRGLVALLAAIGAAGFGIFVVTAGWHLPSDALGAYAITLGVAAAVMAATYGFFPDAMAREREAARERGSTAAIATRIEAAALFGAIALFFGAIAFASLQYGADVNWQRVDAAFLAAMAAIVFSAGLTVAALLRGLSLDDDQIGLAAQPGPGASARGRETQRTSRRVPQ